MKLTTMTAVFAALALFGQSPQAAAHQHSRVAHYDGSNRNFAVQSLARNDAGGAYAAYRVARRDAGSSASALGGWSGGYGARPAAWCGWEMRHLVSEDPGPAFNLARNWAHWGQGGPAGVGAVVVWPHHVGRIVGRAEGMWVVESGNDGHQIRTRPRSIAGAIAIRWG